MNAAFTRQGGLHDLDNSELGLPPLDMNLVAAAALAPKQRRWHLAYDCEGMPFEFDCAATSGHAADLLGRKALYLDGRYNVETARLAVCLERSA